MKKTIRKGTFETNSSSTHSLTIMEASKWEKFNKTDKYLADWNGELYLVDDLIEEMKKNKIDDTNFYKDVDLNNRASCIAYLTSGRGGYYTSENWGDYEWSDWAECYVENFTTPSGDEMVAVGAYGYNG